MSTHEEKYAELRRKRTLADAPAGAKAIERQHERGKRTARERIDALVDPESFTELDRFVVHRSNAFGLDEKDETVGEILRKIMLKANPDGKLVYVIRPDPAGGEETLWITTRAAAAKRGDALPAELAQPAAKK